MRVVWQGENKAGADAKTALTRFRARNIMKHVCVAAKIGADAKDGAEHIANMVKPADKVSSGFGCNP